MDVEMRWDNFDSSQVLARKDMKMFGNDIFVWYILLTLYVGCVQSAEWKCCM